MNAVNLLPEKHRPRRPTGGGQGSSYVLLGGLGLVLVAVLLYVLTLNSINDSKGEIAQAQSEAASANAKAQSLGAYGDFAKVAAQRVDSVKHLASNRFDWERMMRELAHVLPEDVWLTSASAADATAAADGTAPAASSSSGSSPAATPAGGAILTLQGCARDQSQVAVMLVRVRQLQGADDVKLDHSTRGTEEDTAGATSSSSDCGQTGGKPNYAFQASVTFGIQTSPGTVRVPRSLGGGS